MRDPGNVAYILGDFAGVQNHLESKRSVPFCDPSVVLTAFSGLEGNAWCWRELSVFKQKGSGNRKRAQCQPGV